MELEEDMAYKWHHTWDWPTDKTPHKALSYLTIPFWCGFEQVLVWLSLAHCVIVTWFHIKLWVMLQLWTTLWEHVKLLAIVLWWELLVAVHTVLFCSALPNLAGTILRLSPMSPFPLLSDNQVYILLWAGPSLCQVLLSCAVVSRATPSSSCRAKGRQGLHAVVGRALPSLRHHPVDVLAGVLDVARLAVDAVLSIDLETPTVATLQLHVLVHAWTITAKLHSYTPEQPQHNYTCTCLNNHSITTLVHTWPQHNYTYTWTTTA